MSGILSTPEPFGFIQARLGSTRLTGKILECIPKDSEQTLLDHIYKRLRRILPHKRIVFLIPENEYALRNFLESRNYLYFLGSMDDVRDRYIKAAEFFNAKHIIRLTGDNPFIDITSIELLWEAMFYIKEERYCLSMQGLPLGMGVECFSYAALKHNLEKLNEVRHREHVSLHIKENLTENTVYRLIPPHLNENEISLSTKTRMTVDTNLDLEMLRKVWSSLGDANPFFGAKELINLYQQNTQMFSINQEVEQVKFNLPKDNSTRKRISLTYGDPIIYGSGHFERCKSLSIELQMEGYDILSNSADDNQVFDGYIIDSREMQPKHLPALAIDNLENSNQEITYVNFLPHPDLTDRKENVLSFYSSPMIDLHFNSAPTKGQWLVYVGNMEQSLLNKVDDFLLHNLKSKWGVQSWIRVGGSPPISNEIQYYSRLTKQEYYEILSESEGFISYFGQSIMESLYLHKKTVLFGMTEIHRRLGLYLSSLANLIYIGEPDHFILPIEFPEVSTFPIHRNAQDQIKLWLKTI